MRPPTSKLAAIGWEAVMSQMDSNVQINNNMLDRRPTIWMNVNKQQEIHTAAFLK